MTMHLKFCKICLLVVRLYFEIIVIQFKDCSFLPIGRNRVDFIYTRRYKGSHGVLRDAFTCVTKYFCGIRMIGGLVAVQPAAS